MGGLRGLVGGSVSGGPEVGTAVDGDSVAGFGEVMGGVEGTSVPGVAVVGEPVLEGSVNKSSVMESVEVVRVVAIVVGVVVGGAEVWDVGTSSSTPAINQIPPNQSRSEDVSSYVIILRMQLLTLILQVQYTNVLTSTDHISLTIYHSEN